MLAAYRAHVDERAKQGLVPLPLTAEWTRELCALLEKPPRARRMFSERC